MLNSLANLDLSFALAWATFSLQLCVSLLILGLDYVTHIACCIIIVLMMEKKVLFHLHLSVMISLCFCTNSMAASVYHYHETQRHGLQTVYCTSTISDTRYITTMIQTLEKENTDSA